MFFKSYTSFLPLTMVLSIHEESGVMGLKENIKKYRKAKKMTQRELSEISNVSYSFVSKLESGEQTNPSFETITKLANALGVPANLLLGNVNTLSDNDILNILLSDNVSDEMIEYISKTIDITELQDIVNRSALDYDEIAQVYSNFNKTQENGMYVKNDALRALKKLCNFHNINVLKTNEDKLMQYIESDGFKAFLTGIIKLSKESE